MLNHRQMALLVSLAGLLIVGCARTQTYDLAVKNATSQPITIWLTKDGPPVEDNWRSPEHLAIRPSRGESERIAGVVVSAGQIVATGPITGRFDSDTYAWLRVYGGQHKLSGLLAISRGSHNRLDIPVAPGRHAWTIIDQDGRLQWVQGIQSTSPSPAP
jgi:hypothetical protein